MGIDQVALQGQVLDLLQKFSGTEPLKELFWSCLNYDRVNQRTTRRGWPEPAVAALADDPTLLASGGPHADFHVLYSRLAKDRLSLADERAVASRLLKDHPYGLFVFSDRTQTHWHFLNVKMAEEEEKRKLFRRVTVGPAEKMRTASQVISQLDLASISPTQLAASPLLIQERHDQAFDVEPVTQEFFTHYHSTFTQVEALIRGIRDTDRKRLFTQRLFNRLMFIAFIQKKGWLQLGGDKNQDYLNALWSDYKKNGNKEMGFYYERLYNLFFHGLGAQDDVGISKINRGGVWADFIGKVPYLNGGLFEEDEDDRDGSIKVPDEAMKSILQDLFNHFNFTVTEATPLDVEVAVDPEMLGKVFEELVTGRHETGSYYTPKPIVSFMCREALKGYLEANLPKEKSESISKFVDEHDSAGLRDAEAVLEALRRVRVCDPACGSGAYLLGMLHELMGLRTCLFSAKSLDPISAYDRKLEIIQRNVYGVDIDPFAVNIARLRLWLSLAVEFDGAQPEPLPNLKFEIEEGDSLAAPGPEPMQSPMWAAEIEKFGETKARYMKAHGGAKKQLEQEIIDLKRSISSWTHHGQPIQGLDWSVEFAEVFREGGFDILVANPPYVRMELFREIKPILKLNFQKVHSERADLYCYFYARAVELLRPSGMLVFISSNKWLRSGYGENLRSHLASSCTILDVIDFGDLPVFKGATAYPMIFSARRSKSADTKPVFTKVESLEHPYPDVRAVVRAQGRTLEKQFDSNTWAISDIRSETLVSKMRSSGIPLVEYCNNAIYRGIVTGLNEAFVIDASTRRQLLRESPQAKDLIKNMVFGRDVKRWRIQGRDQWLLYMYHGVKPKGLDAIIRHLRPYKVQLEARATEQEWYELQQPQMRYQSEFEKAKIVVPDIAKGLRFALDRTGAYLSNTAYFIPRSDLFLLGVLNSLAVELLYAELSTQVRGGYMRFFRQYMEKIPIPTATSGDDAKIISLVEKCLNADSDDIDREVWGKEINRVVASSYGIDPDDLQKFQRPQSAKAARGAQ